MARNCPLNRKQMKTASTSEQNERLLITQESEAESDKASSEDTLRISDVADELSLIINHDGSLPISRENEEVLTIDGRISAIDDPTTNEELLPVSRGSNEILQEPSVTEKDGNTFSPKFHDEESFTIEKNKTHENQQHDTSSLESRLNRSRERRKQREGGGSGIQVDVLIDKWRKKYLQLQQAKYKISNISQPATSTPRRSTRVKKAPGVFANMKNITQKAEPHEARRIAYGQQHQGQHNVLESPALAAQRSADSKMESEARPWLRKGAQTAKWNRKPSPGCAKERRQ